MPPQRPPSSPTSLLWAHQLKREHGFLLNRMKKLEAEIAAVETRTQEAAAATTARADDVAAIAEQVQRLTDDGGHAAMEKVRGEMMGRFESVGADIQAVTGRVGNLEHGQEGSREEGRRAVEGQKALLRRIEEVEGSMREYERGVGRLGRKVDELAVGKIRALLEGLSEDVKEERVGMEVVRASLERLDEVDRVLRERNERLAEQVRELAERAVTVAVVERVVVAAIAEERSTTPEELDEDENTTAETALPAQKNKAAKRPASTPAAKTTRKPPPKRIAAKTQRASKRGVPRTNAVETTMDLQDPLIDERLKKPIVRNGRGWVEVEEETDEDEDEVQPDANIIAEPTKRRGRPPRATAPRLRDASDVPPIKRGPGRPRKNASQVAPPLRQTIAQDDEEDTTPAPAAMNPPKRGPGRPRKDASKVVPPSSRRNIVQSNEEDIAATSDIELPKRGRGRPRKDALKIVSMPRRSIAQPDETQPPAKKSHKKRLLDEDDSQGPSEMVDSRDHRKFQTAGTPPPQKRQRRGLTGIFTSPLSSSTSPASKPVGVVAESSRLRRGVFHSETSQMTLPGVAAVDEDEIQVQPSKRRAIVQADERGKLLGG